MPGLNRTQALSLGAALIALGICAPAAATATPGPATITMSWSTPFVSGAPWDGSGSGTFNASGASVNDGGSLTVAFHLGAAASPAASTLTQSSARILTGQLGTVTLQCDEITHNATSNLVPVAGHCTVISGTGAYTALHGQGEITGTADLSGPSAVISETVELASSS